ncbi:MAG TPA: type II toxin-antitoxin system RelE/ParE family toxin [Polyangia bacterium]|jgi:Plasmid maintenance system killer protein|nr:type II toxin-antitoxin system RelE/ParE family toxin [Polyangia bacterium]
MIASFSDDMTEHLFRLVISAKVRRFPAEVRKRARNKLYVLDAATSLADLKAVPGNHLEALAGHLAGYYSIRINDQWRVVFKWEGNNAREVRIADYH